MSDDLNFDNYVCLDCGDNTFYKEEYYMLRDEVWDSVADQGMLCVSCFENRLGRSLNSADFALYPINFGAFRQSKLLRSRVYND